MSLIPNGFSKNAAGGAGFYDYPIDGSLRFNDNDSAYLSRTPASAGNRKTWTWSGWVKRGNLGSLQGIFGADDGANEDMLGFLANDTLRFYQNGQATGLVTNAVFRDPSAWYHIVIAMDTTQATASDRTKIYVNGTSQTFTGSEYIAQNHDTQINSTQQHVLGYYLNAGYTLDGYLTEVNFIDGQSDSASITSGSAVVTGLTDTSTLQVGWSVGGTGIASGAVISSIDSSTQITMSENATATNASATLAFTPLADAFGEEVSGVWKPIEYTGSYGANGFYLTFASDTLNTTPTPDQFEDQSANTNHWDIYNLASTDYVLDSPTNNFATLNPLDVGGTATFSEGNLKYNTAGTTWTDTRASMGISSGKWYWETNVLTVATFRPFVGIINTAARLASNGGSGTEQLGETTNSYAYWVNGAYLRHNATNLSPSPTSASAGDIVQIALDMDNGNIWFGLNNTWYNSGNPSAGTGSTYSGITLDEVAPAFETYSTTSSLVANFGQDSSFAGNKTAQGNTDDNGYGDFYYAPPTGYLALCTANIQNDMPESLDPAQDGSPQDHFNTVLYAGNGSTQSITGVGFEPDFLWIKDRVVANHHCLYDAVRGLHTLHSSGTYAEDNWACELASLDADGFSLAVQSGVGQVNQSGQTYAAWNWKAGGTGVSNTDGSITSTVSANTDAGFSIVSYTGTGSTATVGHGLNSAPDMVIVKSRSNATDWQGYHSALGKDYTIQIMSTSAAINVTGYWGSGVSASNFGIIGGYNGVNLNGYTYIAYCFHSVEGFSKIGSYTGNGSTDGTFVYTGFRPAFVMIKRTNASSWWYTLDDKRNTYNPEKNYLSANDSYAEYSNVDFFDFTSNGFKLRTSNGEGNASGGTYIFMAFSESPFKYSTAR